jgi:hypothetical protein
MKKLTQILTVLLAALLVAVSLVPCAFAGASADTLRDPDGPIVGVSNRGLRREYSENSLAGIVAAGKTGIGWVLTDVRKTVDGTFILFADETTERMLDCPEILTVAETTLAELQSYPLKEYSGGAGAKGSEETIPTLEQALAAAKNEGFSLLLKTDVTLLPELCDYLAGKDAAGDTALLVNAKAGEIADALAGRENLPPVIGVKRGNVIFAVWSYLKQAKEGNMAGVQLQTTNRYGVNFHQTVLGRFRGNLRAAADPTDPRLCGAREDSEKWWDDLISRGYSVIVTDEAALFADYLARNDAARERLGALCKRYETEWKLPAFASPRFNDYKKAYTDAKAEADRILSDAAVSNREINDCAAALQKAVDDINANYGALEEGSAGSTVTLPRILICIAAAAVVVAVQVYFYKKKEHKVKS